MNEDRALKMLPIPEGYVVADPFYPTHSGKDPVILPGLEAWTDRASQWPVRVVPRETTRALDLGNYDPATHANFTSELPAGTKQEHLICDQCEQSVYCLTYGTDEAPVLVIADLLAGILSHIRRSHPDVVAS